MLSRFSLVQLFATLWTLASQAPLSMGFSRQEYWSGSPCSPPEDLPDPGIEPLSLTSPALASGFFTSSATWEGQTDLSSVVKQWEIQHPARNSGLRGWSQQWWTPGGSLEKHIPGPHPDLLIQRLWEWDSATCAFLSFPGTSDPPSSLRTMCEYMHTGCACCLWRFLSPAPKNYSMRALIMSCHPCVPTIEFHFRHTEQENI